MDNRETRWLSIEKQERQPNRKTDQWTVFNKDSQHPIGYIGWYGAFRQYSFFPAANTVYEKICLADISKFLTDLMEERKLEKQKECLHETPKSIGDGKWICADCKALLYQ